MTRIEFVKAINFNDNDYVACAVKFFDQNMLLYNLIGSCDCVNIEGDTSSPNIISFDIKFKSVKDLNNMIEIVNIHQVFPMYGKLFSLTTTNLGETTLRVSLTRIG